MKKIIFIILLFAISNSFSQNSGINGTIKSEQTKNPLSGASVMLEDENQVYGVISDSEGSFELSAPAGYYALHISYIGYEKYNEEIWIDENEFKTLNIELSEKGIMLGEGLTVLSSKGKIERSVTQTPVPVDVIYPGEINSTGNVEIGQILTDIIPSFNSQRQTFSDGTDHIDPATLRGLGPDQVLVLINGKRRHTSALVTVTPVIGRGSVGTDLNAIPVSAIERIEILRDGASAQYGSDAIAGVINIVLKKGSSNIDISSYAGQTTQDDGQHIKVSGNMGYKLGDNGFINLTGEFRDRRYTNRAEPYTGFIYRNPEQDGLTPEENFELDRQIMRDRGLSINDFDLRIGNSDQTNLAGFFNSEYQINDMTTFYAFGGLNHRVSRSAGFYRFPNDSRNNDTVYPNGFLPFLNGTINDYSVSAGFKTIKSGWNIDFSNVFGGNSYAYDVDNSLNTSYGTTSPTEFYAGTMIFNQNTTNIDFNKNFGDIFGMNSFLVAFGGEMRYENYIIEQGEEASYAAKYPGLEPGSQVMPGFRPQNATNRTRNSTAAYLSLESDVTDKLFIGLAGRYENYSDFGDNLSGKANARYKFHDLFTVRGAFSTGFRAPSMHQRYFSNTSTIFFMLEELTPFEVATVTNDSRIAEQLGIESLKAETSQNISAGITSRITNNTILTVDAYQIDIYDRIVLSSYFTIFDPVIADLLSDIPGANAFQFFSNAINTRTRGIDIILTHNEYFGDFMLGGSIAANFSETELAGEIKTAENLEGEQYQTTLFSREEQARLESGQPHTKINIVVEFAYKDLSLLIRNVRYGEVTARNANPELSNLDQTFSAKWLTDLELNYQITDKISINAGMNNLLDVYPDENIDEMKDFGRFPYNTAVSQFGFMGSYFYGGLNITL